MHSYAVCPKQLQIEKVLIECLFLNWNQINFVSQHRLVVKTALKLLLVFVEYKEPNAKHNANLSAKNAKHLIGAINLVDSERGKLLFWISIFFARIFLLRILNEDSSMSPKRKFGKLDSARYCCTSWVVWSVTTGHLVVAWGCMFLLLWSLHLIHQVLKSFGCMHRIFVNQLRHLLETRTLSSRALRIVWNCYKSGSLRYEIWRKVQLSNFEIQSFLREPNVPTCFRLSLSKIR